MLHGICIRGLSPLLKHFKGAVAPLHGSAALACLLHNLVILKSMNQKAKFIFHVL